MEQRRWREGDGGRERSGDRDEGTEQNCRQNLVMAEITPILRISGVITFLRVKSQQMKAVDASCVESNPQQSAPRAEVREMEQKN